MNFVDYRQSILITRDADYIFSEGVFLNMVSTNRYLKITGDSTVNEGKIMYDFLKSKNVEVKTMIDVGACTGEVSLYFSMKNPKAKILAIEPSTYNFKMMESNCHMQSFSTDNIILLNEAVGDENKTVSITTDLNSENTLVKNYSKNSEKVICDTLDSIINRHGFSQIDFLKIDIEGAEPLLLESLKKNIGKIKSIIIEIGDKTVHKDYIPLITLFWESGMRCYERSGGVEIDSFDKLKNRVLSDVVDDLWFIKK
ncbi:MAG TPA: FkbM family methyltransferase [Candidatus Paceibacterota bacterium]